VLSEGERVLNVHAEIARRALDLSVTQQQLHRPQVAGGLVDDRGLGPTERVRAIIFAPQSDRSHPLVDQPGILPRADVRRSVGSAREGVVVDRATSGVPVKPGGWRELSRATRTGRADPFSAA
jgi:hypothetical protein